MAAHVPPSPASAPVPLPVQPLTALPAFPSVVELRAAPEALPAIGLAPSQPVETDTPALTARVLARLSNGERIEVGAHATEADAKAEAAALMRFLREAGGDWPFLNGRFVRPEAIVSLDVVSG